MHWSSSPRPNGTRRFPPEKDKYRPCCLRICSSHNQEQCVGWMEPMEKTYQHVSQLRKPFKCKDHHQENYQPQASLLSLSVPFTHLHIKDLVSRLFIESFHPYKVRVPQFSCKTSCQINKKELRIFVRILLLVNPSRRIVLSILGTYAPFARCNQKATKKVGAQCNQKAKRG